MTFYTLFLIKGNKTKGKSRFVHFAEQRQEMKCCEVIPYKIIKRKSKISKITLTSASLLSPIFYLQLCKKGNH